MRILAFDPAQSCGWAVLDEDGNRIASGAEQLKQSSLDSVGVYCLRAYRLAKRLIDEFSPDLVGVEDVKRHAGTIAAHMHGEIRGGLMAAMAALDVPRTGVTVQAIKRAATGRGNASKGDLIAAAAARWALDEVTEDEADALWCAEAIRLREVG